MVNLCVFDVSASGRRLALREREGVFHVAVRPAKCLREVPIDAEYLCEAARPGRGVLRDAGTGVPLEVDFERVACNLHLALDGLQE
jgi:hypothetical protein